MTPQEPTDLDTLTAYGATYMVMILESWVTLAKPGETLDTTPPPSEAFDREEFVVVMPETDLEAARRVAERIRLHVAGSPFRVMGGEELLTVTISIGVATSHGAGDTSNTLLKRADEAVYIAKSQGRNRVIARAA